MVIARRVETVWLAGLAARTEREAVRRSPTLEAPHGPKPN